MDLVFLAAGAAFFAASYGLIFFFARLRGEE